MDVNETYKKIGTLRSEVISQLIKSPWEPLSESDNSFGNKYFQFSYSSYNEGWRIFLNGTDSSMMVRDLIHPLLFRLLKILFVNRRIRNFEKIKEDEKIAALSDKFFTTNKDLTRESKLDKLLN